MTARRPTWIAMPCWPALLLALAGSLSNLAWSFASVQDGNLVLGYIQAGAVDLGLIALAVGIAARRKVQRPTFWLWLGLGFFGVVSVFGNLAHGYAHAQEIAAPQWLSIARPVVLAAVLPALVLILAEVVGHDLRGVAAHVTKPMPADAIAQGIETTHTLTQSTHACPYCGATADASGTPFRSSGAMAAHVRHHCQGRVADASKDARRGTPGTPPTLATCSARSIPSPGGCTWSHGRWAAATTGSGTSWPGRC
jgi:hypothetical protein